MSAIVRADREPRKGKFAQRRARIPLEGFPRDSAWESPIAANWRDKPLLAVVSSY